MSSLGFNRAQRRAAEKVERQTGGILVDRKQLAELVEAQRFLLAIVKSQGRVRVTTEDMQGLVPGDHIKGKSADGSITLSFVGAEPAEQAGGNAA